MEFDCEPCKYCTSTTVTKLRMFHNKTADIELLPQNKEPVLYLELMTANISLSLSYYWTIYPLLLPYLVAGIDLLAYDPWTVKTMFDDAPHTCVLIRQSFTSEMSFRRNSFRT